MNKRIDVALMLRTLPSMDGFTDIHVRGWVRYLPERLIPYALLARFDRPIGAWLLFLPGLWSISLAGSDILMGLWLILLFAIGSVVMRGAGCVVNDLWDRKMDAQVERTRSRPLASGQLGPRQALVFLAILCLIGLVILLRLNTAARILGVLSLVPVALYPLAKRITWWPQVVLGLVFGWAAPMGYAAATGTLAALVVLLSVSGFALFFISEDAGRLLYQGRAVEWLHMQSGVLMPQEVAGIVSRLKGHA